MGSGAHRTPWLVAVLAVAMVPFGAAQPTVFDVVGDSVSAGVNPELTVNHGWVDMLFGEGGGDLPPARPDTVFALWPSIEVHNSAVTGSTAAEWAAPGSLLLQPVLDHEPDLVVVMIGGNDFIEAQMDGDYSAEEVEAFRENLRTIIDQIKALPSDPEIIIVDYYDLLDGLSANLPPLFSVYRALSDSVLTGNQVIRDVAAERGCRFVSIHDDFFHHCYGRELGDTEALEPPYVLLPILAFDVHPVTAGHSAICDQVFAALQEMSTDQAPSGLLMR